MNNAVKVKLCGIRRKEDVDYVNKHRPDYIGFIFAKSKRLISKETAQELSKHLHNDIKKVGVFVNEKQEVLVEMAYAIPLDVIQLHGDEDAAYIKHLREILNSRQAGCHKIEIWKAVRVMNKESILLAAKSNCDKVVLDAYKEGVYGGTGEQIDLSLLEEYKKVSNIPFIVAGGINNSNVKKVIERTEAYGVDISSGIETDGYKDENKIKDIMKIIQGVNTMSNKGRFGVYGGQFVPETLMNTLIELQEAYDYYKDNEEFNKELEYYYREYAGRPSHLYFAERMTKDLEGPKIYIKREDLNHTGSHKINNVLGQALLAKKMGKTRIIAETGAGQHGVASATAAALLGLECVVYMGEEDTERQALNVYRMRLLGAEVVPVTVGTRTLKDAVNEAFKSWAERMHDTHYLIGSVVGPHPFPMMVRDFQSIIGKETKKQIIEKEGRLPDCIVACVGGGSNAMGMFYEFIPDESVRLVGAEAAGKGIDTKLHAATLTKGSPAIFHGMKSYFLQNDEGQIDPVYSISAGLDYPGIGPEHAHLFDTKRGDYVAITDEEAVCAFEYLARKEGIIAAIESSHAVAAAIKIAKDMNKEQIMIINLSGRGDKDVHQIARYRGEF